MQGLVSFIQRYSTKDGPGIRTSVFMTGCNMRCTWCANPETMLPGIKVMYDYRKCTGCGCCVAAAKNNSIILTQNGCEIDRAKCDNLIDMVEICPYDAYKINGYYIRAEDLAKKLLRDKVFYKKSGGGVTFSGGEPMLQSDFIREVTTILKSEGVHVAIDTAGLWDCESKRDVLDLADLVLYDIKAYDNIIHKKCTGVNNYAVLQNAKLLAGIKKDIHMRLIIVPNFNDDLEDIKKRLDFVYSLGDAVKRVDILKYHELGKGKYQQLGLEYPLENIGECDEDLLRFVYETAISKGIGNINIEA